MGSIKILAVDDDRIVLTLLTEAMRDEGFEVIAATNGQQALDILTETPDTFDAIVLDWLMPGMDGIDVLRSITGNTRFIGLPVIMQTSQTDETQIQEAIKAGSYYYITKPYDYDTLMSVVRAAVEKFRQLRDGMSWGIEATAGLALLRSGVFEIQNLSEGHMVANLLADLAERPAPVISGLLELITNAIENGNLSVEHSDKARLIAIGQWDEELKRRLYLPENAIKFVTVFFSIFSGVVTVDIKDCGDGFDPTPYFHLGQGRAYDPHGRGIAMANAFSFKSLEYSDNGSRVRVTFDAA